MTTLVPHTAPFLVWPVSRREFYRAIAIALLPTLAWAIVIFGWRVLGMLIGVSLAVFLMHTLLKRTTARGKLLVFPHSLVSAWVFVALAQPFWPVWIVSLVALFIPLALWLVGGPGHERIHIAVLAALLLQFVFLPLLQVPSNSDAFLARDRLVMGDVRNRAELPLYQWPYSSQIRGNDAVSVPRPAHLAIDTLNQISHLPGDPLFRETTGLHTLTRTKGQALVDKALGKLPSMELLLLGATPGHIGAVSFFGLVWAGLFLAYRYILRPRSVAFFLIPYVLASALFALWPALLPAGAVFHLSPSFVWKLWATFPAEIVTLVIYTLFNSDAPFAAVILLALPGTEPLTARGRQVFLVTAAIFAALLTRTGLPLPGSTLAISLLMPLAPRFDHFFAKRSWLNRIM